MAGYYVSTSLTNDIDALLKERYESRIMELVMVEQRILSRFPKKAVDGGRRILQGVEMSWAGGAMGLPENATLPAPTATITKDMVITPVMYAQRMQISQHAITQGRGSGALKDALTRGTNNLIKGFSKGFAQDTWGLWGVTRALGLSWVQPQPIRLRTSASTALPGRKRRRTPALPETGTSLTA
jgi:hypothetical protein